jgi:hypothetical protein
MNYKIVILDDAKIDYKKSWLWYKDINPKLAIRFRGAFKENIAIIKNNPLLFQIRYDAIRIKVLDIFPYAIHYEIYDNYVVIKAIYHTSRDGKLNIF